MKKQTADYKKGLRRGKEINQKRWLMECNVVVQDKIKCPICNNPVNWTKVAGDYWFNNKVVLLAECWSGKTNVEKPRHLFLIKFEDLPMKTIRKGK
jgi:hypothetical protein